LTNYSSNPKYRPDIDGLRAISVLSVVAFHFFPSWVKGGFTGVDVFFVISGYLISTIIFQNLNNGTFNFKQFYSRRIRRILPALLLVLAASYVLGYFILLADEYKQLGKHIIGSASFISNFVLWNESGYFEKVAETKPLLHLWSLGIEEQFYIFWPLTLYLACKLKLNLFFTTILIAIISFYLNVKGIKHDAIATFFSPQTRIWELMSGSLLAWMTLYKKNLKIQFKSKSKLYTRLSIMMHLEKKEFYEKILLNVASFTGLILLLYSFTRINKEINFPGTWALIPVFGSILIIFAGQAALVNKYILSNRILVWFGLISFPLYLWHWVILTFMRIFEGQTPSIGLRIVAIIASIFIAYCTYRFIETTIRQRGRNKAKVISLILLMSIVTFVSFITYKSDGMQFRGIVQKFKTYTESIKFSDRRFECFDILYAYKKEGKWFCNLSEDSLPATYFVYGDSHAMAFLPVLEIFAKDNKINIQFTGASGCPSLLGIQSMRGEDDIEKKNCLKLNERVFNYVKKSHIKNIILINRWTYYTGSNDRPTELNLISRNPDAPFDKESSRRDFIWAVKNTIKRYEDIGVKVIFVEDIPQQIHAPQDILRLGKALELSYIKYSVSYTDHVKNQKFVNSILREQSANIINFDDVLCNSNKCPMVFNRYFLYVDDDHLSVEGAKILYTKFSSELLRLGW
jgi:peptidoglycan/LPS O-acetylase OafA/YrhL